MGVQERIAMRDIGAARHAPEDRANPRVGKHLLGEDDEDVMYIVLWYGSGYAVQVSSSLSQYVLNPNYRNRRPVCTLGKLAYEEGDDPATAKLSIRVVVAGEFAARSADLTKLSAPVLTISPTQKVRQNRLKLTIFIFAPSNHCAGFPVFKPHHHPNRGIGNTTELKPYNLNSGSERRRFLLPRPI
jgi:hypothetical protein